MKVGIFWIKQAVSYREVSNMSIGALSKDDDGRENVGKKNEFAFFQTSSRLFAPAQYVKCRRLFLEFSS